MADRIIPPPSGGDSGERRPAAPRPTSGYGERPPATRPAGGYSDRPQPTRSSSSYGTRPQPTRSSSAFGERPQSARGSSAFDSRSQATRSSSTYGERRSASSRSAGSSGGRPSGRRTDVIRCENCGEDYSITYKRCPFCDERPGRGGISGKRVANTRGGGYGRPVNPIQIAGLVISLALIASALFIVFRFIGAPIFGKNNRPSNSGSDVSTSQGSSAGSSAPQPNTPPTPQTVQSIALNSSDVSLDNGGTYQMTATLLPAGAAGDIVWSSSDVTAATVDSTGLVTNINAGSSDVRVTITATCNGVTAESGITCKARSTSGPVSSGTRGRIVNAEKGLNIRSGPGKNFGVVASAQNGSTITILGEENGFYKINYSGSNIGYVSKDYVSVG